MALHVIVGAGPVGTGHRHASSPPGTRSGSSPAAAAVRSTRRSSGSPRTPPTRTGSPSSRRARTRSTTAPTRRTTAGRRDWPPLAAALLARRRAHRRGAGHDEQPVRVRPGRRADDRGPAAAPRPPSRGGVRAQMWHDALAAHEAGRIRATEARASDFVGPGGKSIFTEMVLPKLCAPASAPGCRSSFDVPHSLTYTGDVGRTLVALGTDERAWGRAWHVPTAPAVTLRELAARGSPSSSARPRPRLRRRCRRRCCGSADCSTERARSSSRCATSSSGRSCSTRRPTAADLRPDADAARRRTARACVPAT